MQHVVRLQYLNFSLLDVLVKNVFNTVNWLPNLKADTFLATLHVDRKIMLFKWFFVLFRERPLLNLVKNNL